MLTSRPTAATASLAPTVGGAVVAAPVAQVATETTAFLLHVLHADHTLSGGPGTDTVYQN